MKVILKSRVVILVPESEEEQANVESWKTTQQGHVLGVTQNTGAGLTLTDLGPREDACNIPINVSSMSRHPADKFISNFARAPFILDGREYQSVEGFWQGLKFEKESDRRRVAQLVGGEARRAGQECEYGDTITYEGLAIPVGAWKHWELMERACWAKFTQSEEARAALLSTGERPLQHRMRRDSKTIPGAIMAEIWMRIRRKLRNQEEVAESEEEEC
jgi:predicted NAD-dependent protein-ADP-ribosyltransferase YbiA (DUF1768 family)